MTKNHDKSPKKPARPHKKHAAPKPHPRGEEKLAAAKAEMEKLQTQVKELNDKLLRAMAEMENTRRRAERETQEARAYGITGFARDMLSVSDNFRRALGALSEEARDNPNFKPFIEGVEMTGRELGNILERHGIRKVNPKGEAFDHNLHQAMFEIETAEQEPGTVMEVVQEGYVIQNRLLRPAMVAIAKAPKKEAGEKAEENQKADGEGGKKH
ncbi:MAG TPA: nucleotide exchange factor GrpE [Sphingomonadales bacterium]|nr:nucleotide exchange factor GrpE [Sphingomonadales bacterium]